MIFRTGQCPEGEIMLEIINVTKRYGKVLAVDGVSFNVNPGEISVLLGPNGAGKSTIIKCIAGLLRYDGGIRIKEFNNKGIDAKKVFSYVPEAPALYDALTVEEHIEFIARAYALKDYKEYANELFKRFDLDDKRDKLGKELSKGMQQKVSICCAMITRPDVFLLDEPMIGLDPKAIKELKSMLLELKDAGCALLVSTHLIDSIDEIWDKVLIMNHGKIIENSLRTNLESDDELERLYFRVTGVE
jgi:ABC-2 type transport system ATP-binding protein